MAKLINAKCPNCGAILELPETLDRAFCIHCGGKVIIAKDVHYHGAKAAIACPECEGEGGVLCGYHRGGIAQINRSFVATLYGCDDGECHASFNRFSKLDPIGLTGFIGQCKSGKCPYCEGKGRILLNKCRLCEGTGKCPVCKGTNKCSLCKGTGKILCEECNGTGFKVYDEG